MFRRAAFLLLIAPVLGVLLAGSQISTEPESAAGADASATAGHKKITGTIKGTYHLGFADYVQNYDAVTIANVTWEEDPNYFGEFCHCHPYFPTGTIDWSYTYEVKSASVDCKDTYHAAIAAGAGLADKSEQMLAFWDVPGDDTQYYFSGQGAVNDGGTVNCEGGLDVHPVEFLGLPEPDEIVTTTPTFPFSLAAVPQAPSVTLCDDIAPIKISRDATRINGFCYGQYSNDGQSEEYVRYDWDLQTAPAPIIFIHGFLGSQIKCGTEELWPHVGVFDRPQLLKMALADDGVAPAAGACSATVGDIVKRVIINIYGSTVDFLNGLSPGNVYFFNWDWRKAPQESLDELNDKIADVRAHHDNSKVVLMAHSYGGLLARLYVENSGNASNVARVVTIGTPALGSPKALFPLYAGVESPGGGGLNILLDKHDLHEFAKNLAGDYFLYPSANYGPWLAVGGGTTFPLNQQGVLDYVASIGGNVALLNQALSTHAGVLDRPYVGTTNDPKFEVIVGTGIPTIISIKVLPDGHVQIGYGNGDETVPAKSAARGALGPGNPNKAHTYYVCGVKHVPLPGDSKVTDAIDDFLKYGDPIDGLKTHCDFSGFQFRVFRLPPAASGVVAGEVSPTPTPSGPMSVEEAEQAGLIDYLDLPLDKFIITDGDTPEISLPPGAFLEVAPLAEDSPDGKGPSKVYGPLIGQTTVSVAAGAPDILVDGEAAALTGDVNCDDNVTVADALLLLLHAGGTPQTPASNCSTIGEGTFGDLNCDGSVTARDGLSELQMVIGSSLSFLENCG
jgi:pimeloyl-ACP methyl ester carboxylesterase